MTQTDRILSWRAVFGTPTEPGITGVSKSTGQRLIKRGLFPMPIRLSESRTGFRESQVRDWIATRENAMTGTGGAA